MLVFHSEHKPKSCSCLYGLCLSLALSLSLSLCVCVCGGGLSSCERKVCYLTCFVIINTTLFARRENKRESEHVRICRKLAPTPVPPPPCTTCNDLRLSQRRWLWRWQRKRPLVFRAACVQKENLRNITRLHSQVYKHGPDLRYGFVILMMMIISL